jgi:hypothetical protein
MLGISLRLRHHQVVTQIITSSLENYYIFNIRSEHSRNTGHLVEPRGNFLA